MVLLSFPLAHRFALGFPVQVAVVHRFPLLSLPALCQFLARTSVVLVCCHYKIGHILQDFSAGAISGTCQFLSFWGTLLENNPYFHSKKPFLVPHSKTP